MTKGQPWTWLAFGWISLTVSAHAYAAPGADEYVSLPGYKALANYSGNPQQSYVAHSQQNRLAAATAALRACQQANPKQSATAYCEVLKLGLTKVPTAAEIKSAVPREPHPLYLWHYQNGQSNVYLAGSVHILKRGLYPLPVQYQQAFAASDKLVLEVDLSAFTPAQLQFKSMQYGTLPHGQRVESLLPPDMYDGLAEATAAYGLPLPQMANFKPSFLTQQLVVLAMLSLGYDPDQGVEKYFLDQVGDREVLQLETIDFQLGLLMNQPPETQRAMVADTLAQLPELSTLTADLIIAWFSGDDASFAEALEIQAGASEASRDFMRALMDERNVGMADKIAGFLQTPANYFVVIGSGHFVGDNSIIKLLERRGFNGRRVFSDQNLTP
jgi:uncharacterized protein YbaP (TraB family)